MEEEINNLYFLGQGKNKLLKVEFMRYLSKKISDRIQNKRKKYILTMI